MATASSTPPTIAQAKPWTISRLVIQLSRRRTARLLHAVASTFDSGGSRYCLMWKMSTAFSHASARRTNMIAGSTKRRHGATCVKRISRRRLPLSLRCPVGRRDQKFAVVPLIERVDVVVPDPGLVRRLRGDLHHLGVELHVVAIGVLEHEE